MNCCERSRAKRAELAELASLRKARELIVPVIEETKLAHISKTKHFRHMMYRTGNDYPFELSWDAHHRRIRKTRAKTLDTKLMIYYLNVSTTDGHLQQNLICLINLTLQL